MSDIGLKLIMFVGKRNKGAKKNFNDKIAHECFTKLSIFVMFKGIDELKGILVIKLEYPSAT